MLHELPPPHREDCVNSLAYEADARVQDPVYGCVGAISVLQQQVFTSLLLSSPFLAHETSLKRSKLFPLIIIVMLHSNCREPLRSPSFPSIHSG
ncbi:unnamed protein product, partial [Sphagnum compactum]